jgi:endonuclease/exonuclease/phosphatase family metal-dependent hydrolase
MKILQLNIWGGRLGRNVSKMLQRESADVMCLQEVVSIPGGESFFFEDLEEIQKYAGYDHVFHTASGELNFMRRRATFGNAVLSRIPFSHTASLYTYLDKVEDFDFLENTDYNAGRSLQHATVEYQGKSLHILNHHGHHIGSHKNGDEETMRQCGLIADYTKRLEGPVVLCGDFNLIPDSSSLEQINAVLVNHVKDRGIISTRTPLTHKTEACDYIFTSPDIEVKNFQVLDDIVSDHKALTIEF